MRNILIDFTYYQGRTAFHGGGEYGNAILIELLKEKEQINCGIFFLKGKKISKDILNICIKKEWNIHAICDVRNIPDIINKFHYTTIYSALPYKIKWNKIKLRNNVRFIGTFHGLRALELADCENTEKNYYMNGSEINQSGYIYGKKDFEKRNTYIQLYYESLSAFDDCKIIVDSEHTKYSIYYHYPDLQSTDIEVLYPPVKPLYLKEDLKDGDVLKTFGLFVRNYGLVVSAGIWYKNGLRAALAYDNIFEKNLNVIPKDFRVVIVGVKNEQYFWNHIIHKERFILLDYVSEEILEIFYRNAQLFVYPSLNEGFGYPPLEAMKYGTLCACSVNTSISEVCKDMVLYFNPLLIDEIAIRILESFSGQIKREKKKMIQQQLPLIQQRQKRDLKRIIDIIGGER